MQISTADDSYPYLKSQEKVVAGYEDGPASKQKRAYRYLHFDMASIASSFVSLVSLST